jgi:multidrug efflux pump subunit AcrA (membrane-fusion protein)
MRRLAPTTTRHCLLALSLLASIAACGGKKEEETSPVVTVDVAPVLVSKIQRTVRADGLLYPRQQAAIIPKVTSPLKRAYVQRGVKVRAGQLLAELENQDLAGAATESRAALNQAEATFETTSKATVPEDLQKAELDAKAAEDAAKAQQTVFENRQRLYREGAIAQKDVNDAQVAFSQARAQAETARKRLDDLRSFVTEQTLKAAAAQRDAARGRNESAQAQFAYTRLVSPIDGVVTDLPFYPGETAPAGAAVVTVMDVSRVIARAHVSQTDALELAVGNDARIIGLNGVPIPAKITQISPALDASNTTVEVWVEAENKDGALRPGASMKVEIVAKTVPNALVIPQQAVMTSPQGSTFSILIDKENKPHLRKIAVGIRDAGKAQVTDGLTSGDRVATTGAYELFKLDAEVLEKTKVQIAPTKEVEEPEES